MLHYLFKEKIFHHLHYIYIFILYATFSIKVFFLSLIVQVRSAVRKRWHRWQDNHTLRVRVARAMSIPTSPTRISFHSIKQTTAVWANEQTLWIYWCAPCIQRNRLHLLFPSSAGLQSDWQSQSIPLVQDYYITASQRLYHCHCAA